MLSTCRGRRESGSAHRCHDLRRTRGGESVDLDGAPRGCVGHDVAGADLQIETLRIISAARGPGSVLLPLGHPHCTSGSVALASGGTFGTTPARGGRRAAAEHERGQRRGAERARGAAGNGGRARVAKYVRSVATQGRPTLGHVPVRRSAPRAPSASRGPVGDRKVSLLAHEHRRQRMDEDDAPRPKPWECARLGSQGRSRRVLASPSPRV